MLIQSFVYNGKRLETKKCLNFSIISYIVYVDMSFVPDIIFISDNTLFALFSVCVSFLSYFLSVQKC